MCSLIAIGTKAKTLCGLAGIRWLMSLRFSGRESADRVVNRFLSPLDLSRKE
jgi:hypothetical protein